MTQGSLPSWERGLKYGPEVKGTVPEQVAPLVGAWIEIDIDNDKILVHGSLPSWERGLKYCSCYGGF